MWYTYKEYIVEESPAFIYEVSLHKYWKNGYCFLGNKFYKSNKLLNIKQNSIYKRDKNYILEKSISIIGVPVEFIKENKLKLYKSKKLKKK